MAWTALTYAFESVLTSTKMTQNQDNFTALAQGLTGAPKILNSAIDTTGGFASDGGIDAGSSGIFLKMKVLEIGDWNMDINNFKTIAHGLDRLNIRQVNAYIRDDNDTIRYSLPHPYYNPTNGWEGIRVDVSSVWLYRMDGGTFDGTGFDSTSYNRGWVTILYV